MDVKELTIEEAGKKLRDGSLTSVDLTEACLQRIEERNPSINAYITVSAELAREQAKAADARIAAGNATPLTGIPYGVKDAICTRGVRSTGGATILDTYHPPENATVIQKLEDAGAILLGKQNCDAFGHGASNENSMYGPVRNPHDETRVAGGSSGGSAAAVADGQGLFSIAEDTGGSIRFPASLCGVVGLRPSYGRNSRYGCMPMASSLDVVGPLGKTLADVALVQSMIEGRDPKDATTVDGKSQQLEVRSQKYRIGIPKEYFEVEGFDEETREIVEAKIAELGAREDIELVEVSLPHTKYAIPTYYIIVPSEDSSNLARLDGIRYGVRKPGESLEAVYRQSREAGFPEEVKRRIMMGTYALSAGYYDAYYRKAQKVRTLIRRDFEAVFATVDALLTPTSPYPAFRIGEKTNDPLAMYAADVFVAPSALAGVPAMSVPAGKTADGLPVGLQVIGPRLGEDSVFRVAGLVDGVMV